MHRLDHLQIFSLESWRKLVSDPRLAGLRTMLPTSMPSAPPEFESTLDREVLTLASRFFGSPLARFWAALQNGDLSDDSLRAAHRAEAERLAACESMRREHHNGMVHQLHLLKRTWKPPVPRLPRAYKGGDKGSADQLMYSKESGGLVRRNKSGGAAGPLGRPMLHEQGMRGGEKAAAEEKQRGGHNTKALMPGLIAGFPSGPPLPATGATPPPAAQTHFAFGPPPAGGTVDASGLSPAAAAALHAAVNASRVPAAAPMPPQAVWHGGGGEADEEEEGSMCEISSQGDGAESEQRSPYEPPSKRARVETTPVSGASDGAISPTAFVQSPMAVAAGGAAGAELRFFELVRDAIHSVPQVRHLPRSPLP